MTHTLHRRGSEESLKDDFVVFAIAAQSVNAKNSAPKFEKFFEIVKKHNPSNMGDMKKGNKYMLGLEGVGKDMMDNSIVHAVFNDEETLSVVLKELKTADLGLSIVVSGIVHSIDQCCRKNEMKMHTVERSLGIWGKKEKLPEEPVLEISTMCGHGMIPFDLVDKMAEEVANGKTKLKDAAETIASQCVCGVVNTPRVERILGMMAEGNKAKQ
ncbi:MAG: hypothetical protein ACLFN0_05245 [Thermovirgaceae bacterium]